MIDMVVFDGDEFTNLFEKWMRNTKKPYWKS